MQRGRVRRRTAAALVAALLVALLGATGTIAPILSPASAASGQLDGRVVSGPRPLDGYSVRLYAVGVVTPLATAESALDGRFTLDVSAPDAPGTVYYVTAEQVLPPPHEGSVVFASVLGTAPLPAEIVVNERTTVATGFAMAQFTEAAAISGSSPGVDNAARMARNLADPVTGEVSAVLANTPNVASSLETLNSLANLVAGCPGDPIHCAMVLAAATPDGETPAPDTFSAVASIARHPWVNPIELYELSQASPSPYAPALTSPPDAWILALRFVGDGASLNGPGNFAVDHEGNVWVSNNYEYSPSAFEPVCGAENLIKFRPDGRYAPGSPYTGGGLSGAGYGISIDPYGAVWVGNFGFAAPVPGCPADRQPPHNSVSKFSLDGVPLSPDSGFTQGGVSWPQGTVSDRAGNIWIANCGNDSVTLFPDGDPLRAMALTDIGLKRAFDIAVNQRGQAFVTGVESNNVVVLEPDGTVAPVSPIVGGGLNRPLGIAADSDGNLWVANSALIDLPCPDIQTPGSPGGSVTFLPHEDPGAPVELRGGGLTIPWGLSIDGNGKAWVANFAGKRVSQFCGTRLVGCRPGSSPGDPISPDLTGYSFEGFARNTATAADTAGNLWVTNNWKEIPVQANPGGYEVVVLVGIAGPVQPPPPKLRPVSAPTPAVTPLHPAFTG